MLGEQHTEILVVGGGLGGCAAALAVAKTGHQVVLTEQTDWIGGQLTAQAVPPDEHGWIEQFGCTVSYRRLRNGIREYYRDNYSLSASARRHKYLNPGSGWVSPLCHEPRVALAILNQMLAPFVASGGVRILTEQRPVAVEMESSDRISAVIFQDNRTGDQQTVSAAYVLDATELGDLLPMSGVEFRVGSESQSETGEPDAKSEGDPNNNQAMSVCFAVDHIENENHTIERPQQYEFWRNYTPKMNPVWPGKMLDWKGSNPRTMQPVEYAFAPHQEGTRAFSGLWSYRRILARDNFEEGTFASDICTVNWPMIDYLRGHLFNKTEEENAQHLAAAKQQSLSMLYWMQTEAPRHDGGTGYPGLRLRKDIVGTEDGLAKYPYIRESRRIKAEFTVYQQHISAEANSGRKLAEPFEDSIGIGSYRIDLHPSTGGDNYLDLPVLPFQIPLGAIIPIRMENLLPAAKNIGVTHITGGCYRLHPIEWNIGEAAGLLAAYCLDKCETPRGIYRSPKRRREYQDVLMRHGIQLQWPHDIVLDDGDPHVHAK